jgi:predicted nuclease of restriction endonuclease-like (RecB) superfamily
MKKNNLELTNTKNYQTFLKQIKEQIRTSQIKALTSVNKILIVLYYNIGREIYQKKKQEGWGAKIIKQLSNDLKNDFPKEKGFSERNIMFMLRFYKEYQDIEIVKQPVSLFQVSWSHHIILIQKTKDRELRYWYMQRTIEEGWGRDTLIQKIKQEVHKKEGKLISNFKAILPPINSELVQQSFKDPYLFDFVTMAEPFRERELELNLVKHMEKFLLELGSGFAFVGRQYHLEVSDKDFYVDLLFYHLKLRCYVVIELKKGEFKPSYSGQVNFYCSVVDDILAHKDDNPTIGLILCQEKDEIVAEYSLRNISQPIGISEYELTEVLPKEFVSSLPTIEMIESEFSKIEDYK